MTMRSIKWAGAISIVAALMLGTSLPAAAQAQVQAVPRVGLTFPSTVTERVTIESVDSDTRTVAFFAPDGRLLDVAASDAVKNLDAISDGSMADVTYNQVIPQHIQGSLDDPAIRQLLMLASANASSQGVRDDSVGLLAAECRAGHACQGEGIRDALMVALRYDKSEAVRMKALEGLQPYVAEDIRVRNAVLEALLNDSDPRIRAAAITELEPVQADTGVRRVLSTVANSDNNPHIRTVSREVLSRTPVFQ